MSSEEQKLSHFVPSVQLAPCNAEPNYGIIEQCWIAHDATLHAGQRFIISIAANQMR